MSGIPKQARIVEVGPRDGLQNEKHPISTADKISLVNRLAANGLPVVETGSFVSPKWVPQMADSSKVFSGIDRAPGVRYAALTPNLQGFEAALAAGADEVAIFAAASESFSQKNINCSIADSLERFGPVMNAAAGADLPVRGYVSCVVGCPYEGSIRPHAVRDVTQRLFDMGCYEVSLGDTIGVGTAGSINRLLDVMLATFGAEQLAMHCHDTYGQALTNIYAALEHGIATFDSSVAGLGGCPYARGATGNVATEDLVYLLHGLGVRTGVNLDALVDTGHWISSTLKRRNNSRVGNALKPVESAQQDS